MTNIEGAERYWEGRYRDEAKENERLRRLLLHEAASAEGLAVEVDRLRAALQAILDDPTIGVNIALYAKTALGGKDTDDL